MANQRPIRTRPWRRGGGASTKRVVRAVKRSLERSMGSRIHLFDITCLPAGGNAQTDGCPAVVSIAHSNGKCVDQFAVDLSGVLIPDPNLPGGSRNQGAVLSHIDLDMWFAPDFEANACDTGFTDQPLLFRWALIKAPFEMVSSYNQFADGEVDEVHRGYVRRGQHMWWPKRSYQYLLAGPSFPGVDPCNAVLPGVTSGPGWPATDDTGTVVGSANTILTVEEALPFHLKATVRRRVVIKGDEILVLLVQWGNPFLACSTPLGGNMPPMDVMGRIEAHQTIGV